MTTTGDDLTFERSVNARYLEELDRKAGFTAVVAQSRSTGWTKVAAAKVPTFVRHPLVGRVGLESADPDLGLSFYIGPRRISTDALEVISWDARAAKTFFLLRDELRSEVVVRRTMLTDVESITEIADDWAREHAGPSPFAVTGHLSVPAAPTRRASAARTAPAADRAPGLNTPAPDQGATPVPASRSRPARLARAVTKGMRAVAAVEARVAAPRREALTSVLSTLQPDQYELVTHPIDDNVIIQGHPGTGKTIVAVHRSAFLVSEERGDDAAKKVLFIGPTREHADHVRPLINSLDPHNRVEVLDIQTVLQQLAGVASTANGPLDGLVQDIEWAAGEYVIAARARLARKKVEITTKSLYEECRAFSTVTAPEWRHWLHDLPRFDVARRKARYLPFVAFCGVVAQPVGAGGITHVIVDEAQDVRPLEWRVLDRLNVGQRWTLVGDMNQRRVDHCHSSWEQLGSDLAMDDGLEPVTVRVMDRGYRSTEQIMTFANKLLPREQRISNCLQQGEKPRRIKKERSGDSIEVLALAQSVELMDKHPHGTVAIIASSPETLRPTLIRAGWKAAGPQSRQWGKNDRKLALHDHVTSRGVEFDAVVVVEPIDFPQNLGRSGPLYTSLTRANRELVIVHEKPMPDALRKA